MTSSSSLAVVRSERNVELSWERCRSQYLLNQSQWLRPQYVGVCELKRRRHMAGFAFEIAFTELAILGQILSGPIGVALTDREAVILGYAGNPGFTPAAQQLGLRAGAVWSESAQGTNGMGTCLAEGMPVVIEQQHHYLRQNTVLSCYAVPILDGAGRLVGALNASTVGTLSTAPIMALLDMVAKNIEHRTLVEGYKDHYVLRLHEHREFLSTRAECILVIDTSGCIVATNRAALEIFQVPHHSALCGARIQELLGEDIGHLDRLAHRCHEPQMLSYAPFFAVVRAPVQRTAPIEEPTEEHKFGDVVAHAERGVLIEALKRYHGNVTRAAAGLGVSRRTLHRKLRRHRLARDDGIF